jgi:hypothetical protein
MEKDKEMPFPNIVCQTIHEHILSEGDLQLFDEVLVRLLG